MTIRGFLIIIHLDLLIPLAVLLNVYLYFYPVFHFCAFAPTTSGAPAPFRLLALADPQIEGDSKLQQYRRPDGDGTFWDYIHPDDPSLTIRGLFKALDLWGNDLYLAHVYRSTRLTLDPTHTVVLGDLISSQWISDEEFQRRGDRFWRIFKGGEKVTWEDVDQTGDNIGSEGNWKRKVITLPGNHDIGYAGDMTRTRIERFEAVYGPVNYAVNFTLNPEEDGGEDWAATPPTLRIVVLNSLAMDAPLLDPSLQQDSLSLIYETEESNTPSLRQSTLLLTHLPLYKPEGICTDGPYFTWFEEIYGGGIQEQNHLSQPASEFVLARLFGLPSSGGSEAERAKQRGAILTGHDHEGCDVRHYWIPGENEDGSSRWNTSTWEDWTARENARIEATQAAASRDEQGETTATTPIAEATEGVREITARSMMGEFEGNSGLLSAWFDEESDCKLTPFPLPYLHHTLSRKESNGK